MTTHDLLIQQIPNLSDADAAVLLALVQRLRARERPSVASRESDQQADAMRANTAPLADSIRFMGDIESPIDERWDAEP